MALCRLLLPKSTSLIYRLGFSTIKVRIFSSLCSNSDNDEFFQLREDVGDPKREVTAEPYVKENEDVMWSSIKDVHVPTDAMLGANLPRIYHNIDASTHVDHAASMAIASNNVPGHESGELHDLGSTSKSQDAASFNKQNPSDNCRMSDILGANSDWVVNSETLEVNQIHDSPHPPASEGEEDTCHTMSVSKIIASLNSGENYYETTTQSNDSELADKKTGDLESDEVSPTMFPDMNKVLILNQESSSQPCIAVKESKDEEDTTATRLNSSECGNVEKNDKIISNMPVYLGSNRRVLSVVYGGSETSMRLSDIFNNNKDNKEQSENEELLSSLLLDPDRKWVLKSQHLAPPYDLLPERESDDLDNDIFKEFPVDPCKHNLQECENVGSEGGESSSLPNFTQNIFNSKSVDMASVSDHIIEETVKPRSQAFSPSEHSDEPCEEDAEKLSDIKGLIDFIKFHKGVPSNAEIDNKGADLIRGNLSDSNSQRFVYKDRLTSSDFATAKHEIECEGTNVFEAIQSLGASETKETSNIPIPIKDTSQWKLKNSFVSDSSDSYSDSFGTTERKETLGIPIPIKDTAWKLKNLSMSDSSDSDSLRFVQDDRLNLLDFATVEPRMQDEEICELDFQSLECRELKASVEIPNSRKNEQEKRKNTLFSMEKLNENKMLVRFLRKNVTESDILETFQKHGKILKIEISDGGGCFNTAYIYFKERKGLQEAMKETDIRLKYGVITMESTTLMDNMTGKVSVPCLICDPDVPTALIKNPTRTVKIQHLTSDMSSRHFEEALSFCKTNISGCFFGTTNSAAFIEFETEIGKEMALAKHSINVLGRQLTILRIDVPRTTVVRISNLGTTAQKHISLLCQSFGDMRVSQFRCPDVLDVYYKLSEWPNMCNILNRLNGYEVEGSRLRAESAPIFPPNVLSALWQHQQERTHLKTTAMDLLCRLRKVVGAPEFAALEKNLVDLIF